jgi:surface antigen
MSLTRTLAPIAIALGIGACGTLPAGTDLPAVFISQDAQSREELQQTVASALNGAVVTLADDALVRDSTLLIERNQARDASGVPLSGRELGRPEKFQLVKNGKDCVLIHEGSGKRWTLKHAKCSPV